MKLTICPSTNDLENFQVMLVAATCGVEVVKGNLVPDCPVLPYVQDEATKKIVFGVNAITRFLFAASKPVITLSPLDEDLLDIDEFMLKSIVNKALKNKVPIDKYFAETLTGSKAADKKTAAALEEAMDTFVARLGSSASTPAALAVKPTLLVCLKLFSAATVSGKYSALAAETEAIKQSDVYKTALAKARTLTGVDSKPAAAAVVPIAANVGPAVTIDISTDGLTNSLKNLFTDAIARAIPMAAAIEQSTDAIINRCTNPSFGDYQCNNAMALAKALKGNADYKGATTPRDVASNIVAHLAPNNLIQSAAAQPNGFINIHIANGAVVTSLARSLTKGISPPGLPKKKILVDFSSPNIAKEMHVGHLRSTIIGDTLCRVFEFCGHDVMRVNHVGDWGTQFGMLISHLQDEYPNILTDPPNISDLTQIYKAAKKRFDAEPDFKERSRLNVVKLQAGDSTCRTIWELLCKISRAEFQVLYDALGVTLTEVGESFYNPMIPGAIERLNDLGLVKEDQGMRIVMLPGFDIPLIVRKSDGGYGYDSTDMAAISYRLEQLDRDWIVYITDAGQSTHFEKVFAAARAANWVSKGQRLDHIGFGVVQGEDGKKFKTRSSETVKLMDLLNAARDEMSTSLRARAAEGKTNLTEEQLIVAATKIGYGAVKYFDLKQNPMTNYVFSYARMLDTRGDTAVYLMFAYARVASILRKAMDEKNVDVSTLFESSNTLIALDHPAERALAFELMQLGDVIAVVHEDLAPNRLCDYLSELSVKFTDFVTKCQVLNSDEMKSRLLLCEATKRVMAKCFELLGINPLERI